MPDGATGVVDVVFSGRRVWSFHAQRDADAEGFVRWPSALATRLDGWVAWQLVDHATGTVLASGRTQVGPSEERFELRDDAGHPLAIDKAGRCGRMFDEADQDVRGALVDGVLRALSDLHTHGGAQAFLAFGCLLGAVRSGRMIGHDTDADLAVLSPGTTPVDVMIHSYRLQHVMRRRGWATKRMSGGGFKVYVEGPEDLLMGVDVFSAWYDDEGVFSMLPNVRGPLPRESLVPLGTVVLEGREVAAPLRPEPLLALTYGEGWAVPDPSFHFEVPTSVRRRMSGWFRGERAHLDDWDAAYAHLEAEPVREPSDFAAWVESRATPGVELLDLGCGGGRDAVWFAARGVRVTGYDFSTVALSRASERAQSEAVDVAFEPLNFADARDSLTTGARLAFDARPRDLYSRRVIEGLDAPSRRMFWRFCSMVQRRGGRTFVETALPDEPQAGLDRLLSEIEDSGGRVEDATVSGDVDGGTQTVRGRIVASWATAAQGDA